MADQVRPDEHDDPVAAVLAAHRSGAALALATSGTSTSGTSATGPSAAGPSAAGARRVLRTTESWWGSFEAYSGLTGVGPGSRVWVPGPLRSTMNLFAAVHASWAGAELVDRPSDATHACLTPAQLELRGSSVPAGTMVVVAGAALPDRLARDAQAAGLSISHYYGAAELSFVAAARDGAGLSAFPGVEIAVRDEPEPGTIWVRSPWVCDGYDGPPGSLLRTPDGWASVGDIGALAGGTLTVHGRPDAIVTAGATVLVADVEAALRPEARGAFAVHAVQHATLGQVVGIVVTVATDRDRLERVARERLPVTHRPRVWSVLPTLPLTPAGKVDRGQLPGTPASSPVPSGTQQSGTSPSGTSLSGTSPSGTPLSAGPPGAGS